MSRLDIFRHTDDYWAVAPGTAIFQAGEPGETCFAVKEGEVEIRAGDQVLEVVGEGGIFGEMALIDDEPRSASAVTRTECKLVVMDRKRFQFLVQRTPFFALQVMRVLAERLRATTAGSSDS
jgi:CRP-like cAMP-binding protein